MEATDKKDTSITDKTETETKETSSDSSSNATAKGAKAIAGIAALVLVACGAYAGYAFMSKGNSSTGTQNDKTSTKEPGSLRLENNELSDFDLAFLKQENTEENKAYSPMSIKYALSMLKDGADGETASEIDDLIGDYKPTAYINTENRSIANAIFVNEKYKEKVNEDYIDGLKNKYVASLLFDSFENAGKINSWTSDNTKGLIDNLLDDTAVNENDTLLVLVNALAIDMNWNNRIQCNKIYNTDQIGEVPQINYSVSNFGENYNAYVNCIVNDDYETFPFNGNENTIGLQIGATINRYDIINDLGEDYIRETVSKAYQDWLDENEGAEYTSDYERPSGDFDSVINSYMENIKDKNGFNTVKWSTDFEYYTDDSVKAFAKDLKEYEGSTLQYVGIMPTNEELSEFVNNTDASELNTIVESLISPSIETATEGVITKITGNIPVFDFDYNLSLKDDLMNLGVKQVFDMDNANLSKITNDEEQTYVDDAVHKTKIEFTNSGIRAAAATAIITGLGGGGPGEWTYRFDVPVEEVDLTFDKPYLFLIRDKKTGEIWFTGTVYNPTVKE